MQRHWCLGEYSSCAWSGSQNSCPRFSLDQRLFLETLLRHFHCWQGWGLHWSSLISQTEVFLTEQDWQQRSSRRTWKECGSGFELWTELFCGVCLFAGSVQLLGRLLVAPSWRHHQLHWTFYWCQLRKRDLPKGNSCLPGWKGLK